MVAPRPDRRRRAADPRAHPRRPAADDAAAAAGRRAPRRARRRPGAGQPRDQVRRPRRQRRSPRREAFVERVVDALRIDGLVARTSIQCFDWGVLDRVGEAEPALARNLLVSPKYLRGDRRSARRRGSTASRSTTTSSAPPPRQGFTAISPIHGSPVPLRRGRPGVRSPSPPRSWSTRAHAAGLAVIPYVVDDAPTMRHLVRLGVDGLITNHPDRLRDVLADEGRDLPPAFPGGAGNLRAGPERLLDMTTSFRAASRAALVAAAALALAAGLSPATPAPSAATRQPPAPTHRPRRPRPRAGRPARRRLERAPVRPDRHPRHRRHHAPPRPTASTEFAPMGSGLRHPDHRCRPAPRPAGSVPTAPPAAASGARATASAVSPQGKAVAFSGRAGRVWSIDEAGDRVLPLQPGPDLRQGAGRGAVSARTARRARPATAARSTSTGPAAPTTPPRTASSTGRRTCDSPRPDAGRWLGGITSFSDTGSCSAMLRSWKVRWRTCDNQLSDISPDNRHVLGTPAYADGFGPDDARRPRHRRRLGGAGRSPRPATAARRRTSTRSGRTPSTCSS